MAEMKITLYFSATIGNSLEIYMAYFRYTWQKAVQQREYTSFLGPHSITGDISTTKRDIHGKMEIYMAKAGQHRDIHGKMEIYMA